MKFNILIKVLLLGIALLDQIPTVSAFAFSNQSPKITTRTSLIIPTDKYLKYTNHDIHLFASKEIDSNDDLLNALEESDSSDSLASFRESASSNISSLLSSFSDADSSTGVADTEGIKEDKSIASPEFKDNFEWDVYICQSKQCKGMFVPGEVHLID
jgi:hypothetical protein